MFAAELHAQVRLADHLAFKGGAIRHRHIHVRYFDLDAAHLNALLHQSLGALQVVLAFDGVERHGHNMLIGRHARWQNLWNDSIRDDRESEVDGARRGGIFQIVHFAEREHECKDAFLVVKQNLARMPRTSPSSFVRRSKKWWPRTPGNRSFSTSRPCKRCAPRFGRATCASCSTEWNASW